MEIIGRIYIAVAAVITFAMTACSAPDIGNTAASMNLKGAVKSVATKVYEVAEGGGSTASGAMGGYTPVNATCRFDSRGYITVTEYFTGEELTGWIEYTYDADYRLEKSVFHSVLFNGDSTSDVMWSGGTDYIRRTCNEQGVEVSEERFSRCGRRTFNTTVAAGDTVTVITRYRRRRPWRVERIMGDSVLKAEYRYDSRGNEYLIKNYIDGEQVGITEIEYSLYDEAGNWTERILYHVESGEGRTPFRREMREIEYY